MAERRPCEICHNVILKVFDRFLKRKAEVPGSSPGVVARMLLDMMAVRRHRQPKDYKLGLPFDRRLKRSYDGVSERAGEKNPDKGTQGVPDESHDNKITCINRSERRPLMNTPSLERHSINIHTISPPGHRACPLMGGGELPTNQHL